MNAIRSWRTIAVVGMSLGVLSLVATTLIQWALAPSDSQAGPTDVIGAQPVLWLIASLLAAFGPLAWVAGIVGITARVQEHGWTLTTAGGIVTSIGLIAGVGHLALYFGFYGDLASSGVGAAATKALERADDASALGSALLVVFLIGFAVGPILLSIGLRRARLVPVWVPVAAIMMAVANFVGGVPAGIVQLVALVLAFVPMILVLATDRAFGVRQA